MDKKAKKKLDVLRKRLDKQLQLLAFAIEQTDDDDEITDIQDQIQELKDEIEKLKNE